MIRWGVLEMYRKHRSKYLQTIIYEDIQKKPEREIQKLLDVLMIPSSHVPSVMEALKVLKRIKQKSEEDSIKMIQFVIL